MAGNYPCHFLRTRFLKDHYPGKVVSVVNLFYKGYMPDWMCIVSRVKEPQKVPMADYHNKTIYEAWRCGVPKQHVPRLLRDRVANPVYKDSASSSLSELRRGGALADVKIADWIESRSREQRLFHIFNHPTACLFDEWSVRILCHL